MKFVFVTLFENLIKPYFEDSILKKAIKNNLIEIEFVNFRDFSDDKHKKVDKPPAGGGAGMVIKVDVLDKTLNYLKTKYPSSHVIFLTPVGKKFNQKDAIRLSKKNTIIFVSGRYEGFDERIIEKYANEVISIGDFILTGGELASLVLADAISRNIKGVLGNNESLNEESFNNNLLEAPTFTKPKNYKNLNIPSIFLSGNHGIIKSLKSEMSIVRTKYYRPDIYKKHIIRTKYEK